MEMYLNAIYFGNGMYGIDSACRNNFNKSPADIDVAEAAYLAGIVKSPKNYSLSATPKNPQKEKTLY
jgi:penicillin-binding protein 1A